MMLDNAERAALSTIRIEITLHRAVTDEQGEAAMYAAIVNLLGDTERSDDDDWGFDVQVQHNDG